MKKQVFLLSMVFVFTLLGASLISAADAHVFTDVNDNRLLSIDTSGNTNATGWLAENGVKLSDTYLALSGGALTGILSSDSNITTTAFFVGDGSFLTNLPGGDFTNVAYVNESNTFSEDQTFSGNVEVTGNVTATYFFGDGSELTGIDVSMDYTNIAMTNETNTFTELQNFTSNVATNLVEFSGGGSVTSNAGVITYKAGV